MGSFRLWLEGWEKDMVNLGGGPISVKDAAERILSSGSSELNVPKLLGQLGSLASVRRDSRVAIPLAHWYVNKDIGSFQAWDADWLAYLDTRKKLRFLRGARVFPKVYAPKKKKIKDILNSTPLDFIEGPNLLHSLVSDLSFEGNRENLDQVTKPVKILKADGGVYKLYSVSTKKEADLHLAAGSPKWCVLSDAFGAYNGPPYMPIVFSRRGGKPHYVGIFVPNFLFENPKEALKDAANENIMPPSLIKKLIPLLKPYVPKKTNSISSDALSNLSDFPEIIDLIDAAKGVKGENLDQVTKPVNTLKADGGVYKLYSISTKREADLHLAAGSPKWRALIDLFGEYNGPPYMPIVFSGPKGKPYYVGLFIPNFLFNDPEVAFQDAVDGEMMSPSLIKKLIPLLKPYIPKGTSGIRSSVLSDFSNFPEIMELLDGVNDVKGKDLDKFDVANMLFNILKAGPGRKAQAIIGSMGLSKEDILRIGLPNFPGRIFNVGDGLKTIMKVFEPGPEFKKLLAPDVICSVGRDDFDPKWIEQLGLTRGDLLKALTSSETPSVCLTQNMDALVRLLQPGPKFKKRFISPLLWLRDNAVRRRMMKHFNISLQELWDERAKSLNWLSPEDLSSLEELKKSFSGLGSKKKNSKL